MKELQHASFKNADWYNTFSGNILIGGAGGTGSWTSLFLSRNGYDITIIDNDTIEERNLGGQFYDKASVGKKKVYSLSENINKFSESIVSICSDFIDKETITYFNDFKIIFSCFDNITARRILFESWYKFNKDNLKSKINLPIFIDLRLSLELCQIYCINNIERAEKYLNNNLPEENAIKEDVCSMKQTTSNAALIAALGVNFLNNNLVNYKYDDNVRDVPFFFEYFQPLNLIRNDKY